MAQVIAETKKFYENAAKDAKSQSRSISQTCRTCPTNHKKGLLKYELAFTRKVGVPDGMKTPNTGYFKATKTKRLFDTEEQIVEYDFSASDARTALEIQERLQKATPVEQTE